MSGKKIAILGWAFKANTNDSRESAAITVSEILYRSGASLIIFDPMVRRSTILNDIKQYWDPTIDENNKNIVVVKKLSDTKKSDAYLILTEWQEFKKINVGKNKIIFDGRNINQNQNKISIGR